MDKQLVENVVRNTAEQYSWEYLETTPDVKFLPYDMAVDIMENLSGKQYPEIDMSDIVDLTGVIRETLSKFWSNMLTSDISTEPPEVFSEIIAEWLREKLVSIKFWDDYFAEKTV